MKHNMGATDRSIRILLALVIGVLYYLGIISGTIGTVVLVFAGVFLTTSFLGFCPLYVLFGISTCKLREKK